MNKINIWESAFILLLLGCLIIFSGCEDDNEDPVIDDESLTTELFAVPTDTIDVTILMQSHLESFVNEAAMRGVKVTTDGVKIVYDSAISFYNCAGHFFTAETDGYNKYITLNPYRACWDNEYMLEKIIFHALGILILEREESTESFPNGDPKSIMTHGDRLMYSPCIYQIGTVEECNLLHRREYYLDELFIEDYFFVPDWAQ